MRSIGIVDLLKNLSHRSGCLRVHAYTAILLTHLHLPGQYLLFCHVSDLFCCRGRPFFGSGFHLAEGASQRSHSDGIKDQGSRMSLKSAINYEFLVEREENHRSHRRWMVQIIIENDSSLDAPDSE